DSQYYSFRGKCEKLYQESVDTAREYNYAVELYKEKISDDFFSRALKNTDPLDITLEQLEYNVNAYYHMRYTRYDKWKRLLDEWRRIISGGSRQNYNALKKLYIENANVIGITCIQSGTKDFSENYPSFDVVIIDEASKSTPPDIILPMLKGKKIVLVGDHKQLPPFIDSNAYDELEEGDQQLRELIKVSLFEELYEKSDVSMRTMLFRQYRMHRDIAALINQFYINTDAGRLESPASEFKKHCCQGLELEEDNHVLWYDIPNTEIFYEKQTGKSFCNEYEAECIKKILCVLEKNLSDNGCRKSVGVITFYDAQVRLLEDEIINSGLCDKFGHFSLRIGSVDRFQGMEEDIIIVSFVRNNRSHAIGFARDSRRINVAMSRAKDLLIIAGSSENFTGAADHDAAEMFRSIYTITGRLGGLRDPRRIPHVSLADAAGSRQQVSREQLSEQPFDDSIDSGRMNILDYFILKAACEFRGQRLSTANISNVLGIAPVFVENRAAYLMGQGFIEYKNKLIRISANGENTIKNLLNNYNM
ncbi:MAG: DEAD/DEAH box helicase, partial [Porcipelethomonas sp.]